MNGCSIITCCPKLMKIINKSRNQQETKSQLHIKPAPAFLYIARYNLHNGLPII